MLFKCTSVSEQRAISSYSTECQHCRSFL